MRDRQVAGDRSFLVLQLRRDGVQNVWLRLDPPNVAQNRGPPGLMTELVGGLFSSLFCYTNPFRRRIEIDLKIAIGVAVGLIA